MVLALERRTKLGTLNLATYLIPRSSPKFWGSTDGEVSSLSTAMTSGADVSSSRGEDMVRVDATRSCGASVVRSAVTYSDGGSDGCAL